MVLVSAVVRIVVPAVLAMAAVVTAHAGNLQFLHDSPISYFNDEDIRLLKEAVQQVIDDTDAFAQKKWVNPDTGNSGEIEGRGAFTASNGLSCKLIQVSNNARGIKGQSTYTVCKDAEKGWMVDPSAKPPG